jgi:hypothetical protein
MIVEGFNASPSFASLLSPVILPVLDEMKTEEGASTRQVMHAKFNIYL